MPVYWEQRNDLAKAREYSSLEQTPFSFQDVSPAFEVKVSLEKPVVRFSLGSRYWCGGFHPLPKSLPHSRRELGLCFRACGSAALPAEVPGGDWK